MSGIVIEHNPSEETLARLGVREWPLWEKGASRFPWYYDAAETCYILEGRVTVTPENGEPVTVGAGDLVTFPGGMACTWNISEDIRKHYSFG